MLSALKKGAAKTGFKRSGDVLQPDERIVNYMKERNEHAKAAASAAAVQLFALAVYFCLYALISGGAVYSLSRAAGRAVCITLAIVIAAVLAVFNILMVIRSRKVYITKPDSISLRDGEETVRLAYNTARPVLIFKITCSLLAVVVAGMVYIMIQILMEDQALAGLYGRIVMCLAGAGAVIAAYPCIDRIRCYRALLNETHDLYMDRRPEMVPAFIASVAVPASICAWYIFRYYGADRKITWIILPGVALFALAGSFLYRYCRQD
ncbi:MAG: hypothetical protein K6G58_02235 [Lachnospiraceae bacterium]|nr:hypothetical protein [Lachnospiraceae bacterium]